MVAASGLDTGPTCRPAIKLSAFPSTLRVRPDNLSETANRSVVCRTVQTQDDHPGLHTSCPSSLLNLFGSLAARDRGQSDLWRARAIVAVVGPRGVSLEVREFLLARKQERWSVEKRTLLGYVE